MKETKERHQEVSKQISVYKTNTALLELNNCLRTASAAVPWHIHAQGRADEAGYSLIRAVMVDYASRDQSISVYANLTPEQVRYLYVQICQNVEEFSYFQQKIFKDSQNPGRGIVTCFSMCRHTFDAKGQKRRLPWTVEIQNGTGKLAHNKNGGQYCEKKSYEKERAVSVSLQDEDIFLLFARAEAVIRAFEQDALFRKRNAGNFQKLYQMLEKLILGAPDSPKKAA